MKLVEHLQKDFPTVSFVNSDKSRWAPESRTVFFAATKRHADWSLLHEAGHMLAEHAHYNTDIELLQMEVEAWDKARELGEKYDIQISPDHIEDCLDSYRDWLYKRSLCPECSQTGLEKDSGNYRCINCGAVWQVSPERFCRVYRKTKTPAI